MRLKSIALLAVAASLGASQAASAADMSVKAPKSPAAVVSTSWAGFHIGANGGYAWGKPDQVDVVETFAGTLFFTNQFGTLNPKGGFGGAQIGQNFQTNNWVYGFEADFQGADIKDSQLVSFTPYLVPGGVVTIGSSSKLDWFSTVRGRVGYAWDRALLYVTGGLAIGRVSYALTFADNNGFSGASTSRGIHVGYAAGGGFEYMFGPNWSAKAEYQYIDLGPVTATLTEFFGGTPTGFADTTSGRAAYHTARLGINYHFTPMRP